MLKIAGGQFRSRTLLSPADASLSRPYAHRVKAAVFNLLREWFEDAQVLDLFAGVGTMGLEAISRGARQVMMVERDRTIFRLLQRNIEALGCGDRARAVCADALGEVALRRAPAPLDVVFMDPPFEMVDEPRQRCRVLQQASRCRRLMETRGFLVLRSPRGPDELDLAVDGFDGPEAHPYGRGTWVLLYTPHGPGAPTGLGWIMPTAHDTPDRGGLHEAAVAVARKLAQAGHVAYFAGGCVRDRLMGRPPKDYDVATDARPEAVRKLFRRSQEVGEAFGVVLVRRGPYTIEVATFRADGPYSDGRHPDAVAFADPEGDARRRDFTINGLFEDPLTGEIVDHVGGRADIEARVVRAIGDPAERLEEDRLRMLRAIRFAARFTFTIDPATAEAIQDGAAGLVAVSRERIGQEMRWMLTDPNRAVAAWELQYLGLDEAVLQEPQVTRAPRRLARLPDRTAYSTALAAWLLDRHADEARDRRAVAAGWAKALVLSNGERRALDRCLEVHEALSGPWSGLGVAAQKRIASRDEFDEGLLVLRSEDRQAFVDVRRRVTELAVTGLAPRPLITGDDLVETGWRPGPAFGRVLDAVYDAQLEGSVETREQAMALARVIGSSIYQGGAD